MSILPRLHYSDPVDGSIRNESVHSAIDFAGFHSLTDSELEVC
jgi:hypothetical protein